MSETRWAFIHPFQLRLQRGIEVYLWNLTATLAKQGVKVDILTWDGPLPVPDFANVPGVTLHRVPTVRYFQDWVGLPFLVFWLLKGHYQQVFVHFAGYGEGRALSIANLFRFIPFSVVFHFPPSLVPYRYLEFKRWKFDRISQHLIGVSQSTAEEVSKWAERSCVTIGHGVDPERFSPDPILRRKTRIELQIDETFPVLISVAAFEERKGMQWVLRAMPDLLTRFPDLHYVVVGDGPYRADLEHLISELALEDRVHLVGQQSDVRPFLSTADIFMVLSKGEASSISLLEALSCSLPCITSHHPPFDELTRPEFGLQVDEQNINQVSSAITGLLLNPELRLSMGAAAREWVKEHYSWSNIARQYRQLIEGNE